MNGAIVLCGGASSRMGRDKASLPFGSDATLLSRVIDVLQEVVPPANIVVVGGRRQQVPPLAEGVVVIHEAVDGAGPLAALVDGLAHLPADVEAAFACGCDAPLLRPAFVQRLFELSANVDAAVPVESERLHSLAAVYRTSCLPKLRAALDAGERSLHRALRQNDLFLRQAPVDALRSVDPRLDSLLNCNTPEDYALALARVASEPAP